MFICVCVYIQCCELTGYCSNMWHDLLLNLHETSWHYKLSTIACVRSKFVCFCLFFWSISIYIYKKSTKPSCVIPCHISWLWSLPHFRECLRAVRHSCDHSPYFREESLRAVRHSCDHSPYLEGKAYVLSVMFVSAPILGEETLLPFN